MSICYCCPAPAEFTMIDHGEHGDLPICELCLAAWLETWPEDGARVRPGESLEARRRLLRMVCGALKRNRELLDMDRVAPGDVPEAVRTAAHVAMDARRAKLEGHVNT